MPFCNSCNAQVREEDRFCSNCGTRLGSMGAGGAEECFEALKTSLHGALEELERAYRCFSNREFTPALKATAELESLLKSSRGLLREARREINLASVREEVNHAEAELVLARARVKALEEEQADADSRGVDTAKTRKVLGKVEAAVKDAARALTSSRATLKDRSIDGARAEAKGVLKLLNRVSGLLDSCRKELEAAEKNARRKAQKRLEKADKACRRAEAHVKNAAASGAPVEELSQRLDSIRRTLASSSAALLARRYRAAGAEANAALAEAGDVIEQARLRKSSHLVEKAVKEAAPRVKGRAAGAFIQLAEEAGLDNRFPEAVVLLNKALIATQIHHLREDAARIENHLRRTGLALDLTRLKEGILRARELLEGEEWRGSLDVLLAGGEELRRTAGLLNAYIDASNGLVQVRELCILGIKQDTSAAEEALAKASELMKAGKLEESSGYVKKAGEEVAKYRAELEEKYRSTPILGLFRSISKLFKKKHSLLDKFEPTYEGIAEEDLITPEYAEP